MTILRMRHLTSSAAFLLFATVVAAAPAQAATTPALAPSLVPASSPALMPAKTVNCGWGMRTKKHSCDAARSLAWAYKAGVGDYTRPKRVRGVYSPNSGREYNFKCSGRNSITCSSGGKANVYLKWNTLPEEQYCGDNTAGHSVFAWLNADCDFALATAEAYLESPATYLPEVVDPADGLAYPMTCYTSVGTDMLCVNNADVVIVRS
jgi:hypothetical protein